VEEFLAIFTRKGVIFVKIMILKLNVDFVKPNAYLCFI